MTTIGRHIPIYDAWSNEGGGREIEEATRYSERVEIAEMEAEFERHFNPEKRQRAWTILEEKFAAMRTAFIEKHGADALEAGRRLAGKEGAGDTLEFSPEAKAMLADLATLDGTRSMMDRGRKAMDEVRRVRESMLEGYRAGVEARQATYDSRFEKDDNRRADAYERAEAARTRLRDLAAQNETWNAEKARQAGEVAAAAARLVAPFASTKLFFVNSDGSATIDGNALARLTPSQLGTSELAQLIGALTERNGLGQLRDALVGVLDRQNRRIANLVNARG